MTDPRLAELDLADATERPHTGPAARLHRAAPAPKAQRARASDPGPAYWIVAMLWRPMSVETIARVNALPEHEVVRLLALLQGEGRVRMLEGGMWERVTKHG